VIPFIGESLMRHRRELRDLERNPSNDNYKHFAEKCTNYYSDDNNVYIFSMDDIDRFVKEGAQFLMIIVGSQRESLDRFKTGQPTVMIAGCNPNGSNEQGPKYQTLQTLAKPVTEHPPFRYETTLPFLSEGNVIEVYRVE